MVFVLESVGSFSAFLIAIFYLAGFTLVYFLKHGFFQFKQFVLTKLQNLPYLILSFSLFLNNSNSFSLCYIDLVNLFCVISMTKYIRFGLCVSVWMGRNNF